MDIKISLFVLVVGVFSNVSADTIYKYKDEAGKWVFSDTKTS